MDIVIKSTGTAPLFGEQLEIKAMYQMQRAKSFGFAFIDDEDEPKLVFDFQFYILKMADQNAHMQYRRYADQIQLHIFVDHSVIEIFVNQQEAFTIAFYPKRFERYVLKIISFSNKGRWKFSMDV